MIAIEFKVGVIIGISVSADLPSQTSATFLFVSMSISPKTPYYISFQSTTNILFCFEKMAFINLYNSNS